MKEEIVFAKEDMKSVDEIDLEQPEKEEKKKKKKKEKKKKRKKKAKSPSEVSQEWLHTEPIESEFEFKDISFVVGKKDKKKIILDDINGRIGNGSMLAIMGPSGAGKTSLLKALALGITSGKVFGSITLNGDSLTNQSFKDHCFLVEQYDHHWPFLTTRETLDYAAALLLGPGNHDGVVDAIIEKMGLVSCQDTKVGNDFRPGLSGGQKRRLSIGIALLKKPAVILLDEPTSGLDASGAVAIVEELRALAKSEKIIIITSIHQPSTKVYNKFDLVMLLSKGKQAYMGKAKEAPQYFAHIGYPMEEMTNPAEFLLDLVNADFSSDESVDKILEEWNKHKASEPSVGLQKGRDSVAIRNAFLDLVKNQRSLVHELKVLFRRHAFMIAKDPFLYVGRSAVIFAASILFSLAYWNSRERVQDQAVNYFFGNVWNLSVASLLAVVAVYELNGEFKSASREVKNGLMHPLSYMSAKSVLVIPVLFVFGICGISASAYGILGCNGNYGIYLLIFAVGCFFFECLAEMLSVLSHNPLMGMLEFLAIWFGSFLFAGTFIPSKDLPGLVRWLYYVLPFAPAFSATAYTSMINEPWESCDPASDDYAGAFCIDLTIPPFNQEKPGVVILDAVGRQVTQVSSEDQRAEQLGTLIGAGLFLKCVYIALVLFKSSRATKLHPKDTRDA